MTWLLVEDDSDIRNVVSVMMSVWGEKPLPFPDGGAAWDWLDSVEKGTYTGELPDLALMDIRMPGYTGDKVAARIRTVAALKHIPIILMTAFSLSDSEIKEMMEQTGVDHLINKPLPDMEIFRSTLYRVRDEKKVKVARQTQSMATVPPPVAPPTPPIAPGVPAPQAPAPVTLVQPAQGQSATPAVPTPPIPPQAPAAPASPAQPTLPIPAAPPSPTPTQTVPATPAAPATPPSGPTITPSPAPQPPSVPGTTPAQPSTPSPAAPATPPAPAVPTEPSQPPVPAPTTPATPQDKKD